jgi:antitoxin component YwqK of YwqJK toxin-antitoxin module
MIEIKTIRENDKIYQGEVLDNIKNGYGKLWTKEFNYYGNFKNNKFDGEGLLEYNKDCLFKNYNGEFKDGKKDGYGKEVYINGEYYLGYFKNDLKNGKGKLFNKFNNIKLESEWINDLAQESKFIIEYYDNGNKKFEGKCNGLKKDGFCKEYDSKEKLIFEGEYVNDERVNGKIYLNDIIIFNGSFENNEPNKGIFYYENGVKIADCEVINYYNIINDKDRYLVGDNIILFYDDGSLKFEGNLLKNKNIFNSRVKTDSIFIENKEYKIKYGSGAYYEKGKLFPKFEFQFYENEKKKFIKEYNAQNILVVECNYDINGKLVKELEYYHNGDLKLENLYVEGNLNIQHLYWQGNKLRYKACYIDDYVNLIEYNNHEEKIYEGRSNSAFRYFGLGKLYRNNQLIYEGNFNNGKFQGSGILYENGLKVYEGEFENDVFWGSGISYYEITQNIEYDGEWVNGSKHGQGTLYSDSGEIVYSGTFHNNEIQMN